MKVKLQGSGVPSKGSVQAPLSLIRPFYINCFMGQISRRRPLFQRSVEPHKQTIFNPVSVGGTPFQLPLYWATRNELARLPIIISFGKSTSLSTGAKGTEVVVHDRRHTRLAIYVPLRHMSCHQSL